MKTTLSDALKSRYENVPDSFRGHVEAILQTIVKERTELNMHRKPVLTAIFITALLLATMGVALALSSMGILDFRKESTGKEVTKQAAEFVQRNLQSNALQLGDCTVTVKEVMSDGLSGNVVVEYRLPEGMYLYDPNARAPGTYYSAENKTMEELLEEYDMLYMPMEARVGYWVDGKFDYPNADVGYDPVKLADNVIVFNVGFTVDAQRMADFVCVPGVHIITGMGDGDRERLRNEPIHLGDFTDTKNNVQKIGDVPKAFAKEGVESIAVTFTPLSVLVTITFDTSEHNVNDFHVVDEKGEPIRTDFISCFIGGEGGNRRQKGYTAPESIPETLRIRLFEPTGNDGEVPIGGIEEVVLK